MMSLIKQEKGEGRQVAKNLGFVVKPLDIFKGDPRVCRRLARIVAGQTLESSVTRCD